MSSSEAVDESLPSIGSRPLWLFMSGNTEGSTRFCTPPFG